MSESIQNLIFKDFSTSAIGGSSTFSSADPTNLASIMLTTEIIIADPDLDINSSQLKLIPTIFKGYRYDFELEQIMDKYDPALQDLSKL